MHRKQEEGQNESHPTPQPVDVSNKERAIFTRKAIWCLTDVKIEMVLEQGNPKTKELFGKQGVF